MLSKLKIIIGNKNDILKISIIFIGSLLAALSEIISIGSIPVFVTLLVDPQLFQSKLSNYIFYCSRQSKKK